MTVLPKKFTNNPKAGKTCETVFHYRFYARQRLETEEMTTTTTTTDVTSNCGSDDERQRKEQKPVVDEEK